MAGCAIADDSHQVIHATDYSLIKGPINSVTRLENKHDIDHINETAAQITGEEVRKINFSLLGGWDFYDICRGGDACWISPNHIYLEAGAEYDNLILAHEIGHVYLGRDQGAATDLSCMIFPEYLKCSNQRSVAR